jgi:eukaryotic-like serine/threonine-protein kinase
VFKFITHRPLWVNILVAIGLAVGLFFLFLLSLSILTKHDKIIKVPSVKGKSIAEARKLLDAAGFELAIQDSVYVDTISRQQVLKQFPEADATVKISRTVYLTISRAVPPLIEMPDLTGLDLNNAMVYLDQFHLKLGDTLFKPYFAKYAVLEQLYNGLNIKPGTKIPMGTKVSLVLGSGLSDVDFEVPDLVGLTFREAKDQLNGNGLLLASVIAPMVKDSSGLYVYKQNPERLDFNKKVRRTKQGLTMDLWLSVEKPVIQNSDSLSGGDPSPANQY